MKKNDMEILTPESIDEVSGGYIIKDEAGYHAIGDKDGLEIHCFPEEEYDRMMNWVTKRWKISDEYITWEDAHDILVEHRKSLGIDPEGIRR